MSIANFNIAEHGSKAAVLNLWSAIWLVVRKQGITFN